MIDDIDEGFTKGAKIRSSYVSHFIYVDNMIFLTESSRSNVVSILHILDYFNDVSVLRINLFYMEWV